jgi:PAS domain S-box-containing protein
MTIARQFVRLGLVTCAVSALAGARPCAIGQLPAQLDQGRAVQTGFDDDYTEEHWSQVQGFPSDDALAVAQTTDGLLWIATSRGLVRYDGLSFRTVTTVESAAREERCSSVLCDRRDRVWAGFGDDLRRRDRDHGWRRVDLPADRRGGAVVSIAQTDDDAIWCSTERSLFRIAANDVVEQVEPPARDGNDSSAWELLADPEMDGQLYARCASRLGRRDGSKWTQLAASTPTNGGFTGATPARRGGVWLADHHAVRRVVDDRSEQEQELPITVTNQKLAMHEDRRGQLWLGSELGGFGFLVVEGTRSGRNASSAEPSSCITAIFEDREGVVHVGTADRGLTSLTPKRFHSADPFGDRSPLDVANSLGQVLPQSKLRVPERLNTSQSSMRQIACIAPAGDELLVATSIGVVVRCHVVATQDRPKVQFQPRSGLNNIDFAQCLSIAESRDGATWVGTADRGLWRQSPVSPASDAAPSFRPCFDVDRVGHEVVALLADGDGLLVASDRGLFHCTEQELRPVEVEGGPKERVIRDLSRDPDSNVWAAGDDGLLRRDRDGSRFRRVQLREAATDVSSRGVRAFRVVAPDLAVVVWLDGSGLSVVGLGASPLPTVRFSESHSTDLLADASGHVWINSDRGLDRFELSELRETLQQGKSPRRSRARIRDGLPSISMVGPASCRAASLPDGHLWFATDRGLVWFDPAEAVTTCPPVQILVDEVVVDGRPRAVDPDATRIDVPAGANRVQLRVAIPATRSVDDVEFEYRPVGVDLWTRVGRQRDLDFPALHPGVHAFELRACNGDGVWMETPRTIEVVLAPFFWQTNWFKTAAALAVGAAIVVTMRRRQRTALGRERERSAAAERFAAEKSRSDTLLAATEELVCFADADRRVVSMNAAGCRILGERDESRLRSLHLADLFAAPARATIESDVLATLRDRELWSGETELAASDGTPIRALCTLRAHRRADGTLDHWSLVARDLTERVETERTRRRLESELRQAQKLEAIGTLAGGIAHDFNNLLTAILGHAELAREALPRDPRSALEGLDEILEASGRARDLVRQILRFSRRSEHQRSVTTLFAPVQEACRLLHSTLPASIQLVVDLQAQEETVIADPTEIHQCVVNLGTNAAQALTGGSGRIDVKLEPLDAKAELVAGVTGLRVGRYVRLTVADNGCGMTPQVLERAFDPFFTTKPMGEGTGLGLSLVHAIVTSHDGAITVQSELGRGTRFEVYFPVVDAAIEAVQPIELEIPTGQGEELLLVDDERAVLDLSRRMLERLGYRVVAFQSPSAALARFEANGGRYAALVTDLVMSDLNGLQLARRLRAKAPDLPVVLVTGYLVGLDLSDLTSYGVDEIVAKPFTMRSIAEALHRVMQKRRDRATV